MRCVCVCSCCDVVCCAGSILHVCDAMRCLCCVVGVLRSCELFDVAICVDACCFVLRGDVVLCCDLCVGVAVVASL